MIHARIRREADEFIIDIPRAAMETYGLAEGDVIAFTPLLVGAGQVTTLSPHLEELTDKSFSEYRAAFEYLADR